jgi:hypothetical protein
LASQLQSFVRYVFSDISRAKPTKADVTSDHRYIRDNSQNRLSMLRFALPSREQSWLSHPPAKP